MTLLLGLVGLYARQSEAAGSEGLVGFLVVFLALVRRTALAMGGVVWPALLANPGWVTFGISSLRARIYPPAAAQPLIAGAMIGTMVAISRWEAEPVGAYFCAGVALPSCPAWPWSGWASPSS